MFDLKNVEKLSNSVAGAPAAESGVQRQRTGIAGRERECPSQKELIYPKIINACRRACSVCVLSKRAISIH